MLQDIAWLTYNVHVNVTSLIYLFWPG